jgi:hypothetical protein
MHRKTKPTMTAETKCEIAELLGMTVAALRDDDLDEAIELVALAAKLLDRYARTRSQG